MRPLRIQRSAPGIDPAFLLLAYSTSLSLHDTLGLREEAREVWARFHPLVQRAGVFQAVLQANARSVFRVNLPLAAWFQVQRQFTFVANRQDDGTWLISGDTVPLPGAGGAVLNPYPKRREFAPLAPRP